MISVSIHPSHAQSPSVSWGLGESDIPELLVGDILALCAQLFFFGGVRKPCWCASLFRRKAYSTPALCISCCSRRTASTVLLCFLDHTTITSVNLARAPSWNCFRSGSFGQSCSKYRPERQGCCVL